jgi:choline dehydrogenase-like flavoprotein
LASGLAASPKRPSVLLIEAGPAANPPTLETFNRYSNFSELAEYNWGYTSTPQTELHGRQLDYSRGRGLGGTSNINVLVYTVGSSGDFDHWAKLVGDDFFNWENSHRRYKEIETFDFDIDERYKAFVDPDQNVHGTKGRLNIGFPKVWEHELEYTRGTFDAVIENDIPLNKDINSGNPIGFGMSAATAKNAARLTAAGAFLRDPPPNLRIVTEAQVERILLKQGRAVGVEAAGKTCGLLFCLFMATC